MVPSRQVDQAVEDCIASPRYRPPPLPILFTSRGDWHPSIMPETTTAKTQILSRSAKKGKEVFDFAIFLLLEADIDDLPGGLLSTMRSAIQKDSVLNAVMAKIHPSLVVGVSNVKNGFYAFVKYVWEGLKKDMVKTAEHLRGIFSPILEAASATYLSEIPEPKSTKRAREPARSSKVPANIVFLRNLRNRQLTEAPNVSFDTDSEVSYQESSSAIYSPSYPVLFPSRYTTIRGSKLQSFRPCNSTTRRYSTPRKWSCFFTKL
ncbi:hypothetical protein C8F04DRAFT_1073003 [Mycena alexandri]|uniref:Uncharacterized protein n=1 Tax=Mycena alexandri TaxID=1745969 RepID=A0AAD6TG90_9AGAR|nr:hypothetical protein C8F04DRAFT_1073003 [Mycena alexandri]